MRICEECDGRGRYLDAAANVLAGRTYWETCPVCAGSGELTEEAEMSKKPAPEPDRDRERPDHDLPAEHPERPARPDEGDPEPTHPIAEPPPPVEPAPQS